MRPRYSRFEDDVRFNGIILHYGGDYTLIYMLIQGREEKSSAEIAMTFLPTSILLSASLDLIHPSTATSKRLKRLLVRRQIPERVLTTPGLLMRLQIPIAANNKRSQHAP